MITSFFGFKLGSAQTFDEQGKCLVATKVAAGPVTVERIKTDQKDGYKAIIVKIKGKRKDFLRELKADEQDNFKAGDNLAIDQFFKVGDKVMVSAKTKGKGFAGVVKRWGFAGGPKTHGQSDRHRAPGSIGQRTDPGRVWRGKKMAGRMGGGTKTIKGLKIYKIDKEKNELWLKGVVPGAKNNLLKIVKSN